MFYFLLFIGTAMILHGLRGMKKQRRQERRRYFAATETDEKPDAFPMKEENQETIADLTDRMSEMEKSLFEHLLKWQVEKEELLGQIRTENPSSIEVKSRVQEKKIEKEKKESREEIIDQEEIIETAEILEKTKMEEITEKDEAADLESKKKPMPDNIRKVMDYEEEGLSIQQIANVTRMNKGEVLLLRNLSKHYRK